MDLSFTPPRQITIGDAASFIGTTPRAIRHYHDIGLLPEPERGTDDRRRYGHQEMIRLLWIRRMAEAGVSLADMRDAFADPTPDCGDADQRGTAILERLEGVLLAREEQLRRQRATIERMRHEGSRTGLLSDFVTARLANLPQGSLRSSDLDSLLVFEQIFGPLGAAVHASRYIALATHPGLRQASDRIEAAEESLDDSVAVDDPRVASIAAQRYAFEEALHAVIEDSGLAREEDALFDQWESAQTHAADGEESTERSDQAGDQRVMSAADAVAKLPYDFSPARLRCMKLAEAMGADEHRKSS